MQVDIIKNIKKIQKQLTTKTNGSRKYNIYLKRLIKKNTKLINFVKMRTEDQTIDLMKSTDFSKIDLKNKKFKGIFLTI